MQKVRIGLVAALFLGEPVGAALADPYTFTTITVPSAVPVSSTVVSGINDIGQAVGTYVPTGSTARGFIDTLATGTVTTFYDPASQGTFGNGINNASQVVGSLIKILGFVPQPVGYVRNPVTGAFSLIDILFPTPLGLYANGVNNAGQIVGSFPQPLGIPRDQIFLTDSLTSGGAIFFSTFRSSYIDGYGVNDLGQVVGKVVAPTSPTTAIISGFVGNPTTNTYTMINVPGATSTTAYGINNKGQIVGDYTTGSMTDAFEFDLSTGLYTTFSDPGATSTIAYGINNAGQIVGSFTDSAGISNGFLATPVPEPASLVLLGGGVFALAMARRNGRQLTEPRPSRLPTAAFHSGHSRVMPSMNSY